MWLCWLPMFNVAVRRCELYNLWKPHGGRCCTGEGTVTRKLLHHQCLYICLQSTTCKAYNYNITEETCTRFASVCPQAYSDPTMECVVFRKTPINQCYEWVPCNSRDPIDERMIATDCPSYIVARLHVSGNDVVCYFSTISDAWWGNLEGTEYSTRQGYQCERLHAVKGCTIYWVPYTAGGTLPSHWMCHGKWWCGLCGEAWLHLQGYSEEPFGLLHRGRHTCNKQL